jgi:hypothetical protein
LDPVVDSRRPGLLSTILLEGDLFASGYSVDRATVRHYYDNNAVIMVCLFGCGKSNTLLRAQAGYKRTSSDFRQKKGRRLRQRSAVYLGHRKS